jgi:hypothetical protein
MDPTTRALAMGAAGSAAKTYIEDVFSTWLYTGNGSTQTITNGIDLAGEGGLVWIKARNQAYGNRLLDSARTNWRYLESNSTNAENVGDNRITPNSDGFTLNSNSAGAEMNVNTATYASWTFRKAEKFFDAVTYTGTGSAQTIAHNLGSTPGVIIVKALNDTQNWAIYHRALGATQGLVFTTAAAATSSVYWNDTAPTSTQFTVGSAWSGSSKNYVAYLFAHDAGGFGDDGNQSVIKCGFSNNGTFNDLGWEPQWILVKSSASTDSWFIYDNMRGIPVSGTTPYLNPNTSGAEANGTNNIVITPTGFTQNVTNGIWIAIRRGPMKTPTDATKVFSANTYTGTGTNSRVYTGAGFPPDAIIVNDRLRTSGDTAFVDRLRGGSAYLATTSTAAEVGGGQYYASKLDTMDGYVGGTADFNQINLTGLTLVDYYFRRAPGFFDVVAYTGTNAVLNVSHNLSAAPEMMICRQRGTLSPRNWWVYHSGIGNTKYLVLNTTAATVTLTDAWNNTTPTSSVFTLGSASTVNQTSEPHIAYLFATCPGVSKCFNFTGTGTTLQIDCGFTNGARFVMIKRTDSTGDWYVWDSARGIISGNDPYLLLNSTAAEVTNTDYIDSYSAGFEISSTAPAAINANGGSYIGLAIA